MKQWRSTAAHHSLLKVLGLGGQVPLLSFLAFWYVFMMYIYIYIFMYEYRDACTCLFIFQPSAKAREASSYCSHASCAIPRGSVCYIETLQLRIYIMSHTQGVRLRGFHCE